MRIVHIHLPKTAGAALRHSFERLNDPPLRVCPAIYENEFTNFDFSQFDFFSGHISFSVAEKIEGDYVTVLRDPVDRFLSAYYFWQVLYDKDVERSPKTFLARNYALEDFVNFLDSLFLVEQLYNMITWQLAYATWLPMRAAWRNTHKGNDLAVLELAKSNLAKCKVVGFQESYGSFLEKLNHAFGIDLQNVRVNVTQGEKSQEISQELRDKIYRWVYLDMELYNYARMTYGMRNSMKPT